MREVFLSHAGKDHAKARRLKAVLAAHDVPVWFAPHHIAGAQKWQDEIGAALDRCDWFMVLLTPSATKSMWVKREVEYAMNQERFEGQIIPLNFKACDSKHLSWVLPQIQTIDFTKDFWHGWEKLLHIWDKTLKKPARRRRQK